ncbi:alpha-galactosidase [uncultured Muribaculum sp.]|uniref:alpha-galactosidase D n=1 Tax=uncultured Muribaculum sp. TaxID=1918613 RepID=UPI0025B13EF4|nr:alpha-galactosidase [uncultured Muribaculum sp.]
MKKLSIFFSLITIFTTLSAQPPAMGWSSWNTYHVNISDSLIIKQANAMIATGLADAGYRYINIDDGYFGGRDKSGRLLIHPTRFPNGLKPVVEHIHNLGLKAGIYSDAGSNTCGSFYDNDTIAIGVGLYGHDKEDANFFFNELGFDFIKVDFCGGDGKQNIDNLTLDEQKRYTEIASAIKSTGRKDVVLNVCRWDYPGTWVSSIASSWRISHDIRPRWSSVKDIISQNMYLSAYCSNGHYNDMDMLEVGRGMTEEEDKTHFGLWCIMSSPLMIGCDLTTIKPHTLDLLKNTELIAINQDTLGKQAYIALYDRGCMVFVKDILQHNGKSRAVAFYNPTDTEMEITLPFRHVDLDGCVKIRDLFEHKNLPEQTLSMTVKVPSHGTRIYRLDADKRLQQENYEAETAYISAYQEIENNIASTTGIYEPDNKCSGGAKASWLGGKPENDLVWRNVYVNSPGSYTLNIYGLCPEPRTVDIDINGKQIDKLKFATDSTATLKINLKKGYNCIRLHNDKNRMPDIDRITISTCLD